MMNYKSGILKQVQDDRVVSEAHRNHKPHLTHAKRAAFTLAEVLITLGIIGVVAAMTIPTLIAKYQERQVVSSLTKVYSTLSQAYQMAQAEHGQLSTWGLKATNTGQVGDDDRPIYDHSANQIIVDRIKKYLRISKTCEAGKVCYPGAYYSIGGVLQLEANHVWTGDEYSDASPEQSFFLNDGTYVSMGHFVASNNSGSFNVILPIGKDAVLGKNRFYFIFNDKGVFPAGMKGSTSYSFEGIDGCDPATTSAIGGMGCAAWVIYNKNMDYLHCRDKLSWDGSHSCKDAEN